MGTVQERESAGTAFHDRVTLYSFILTILVIWIHAISIDLNGLAAAELAAADPSIKLCFYLQRILGTGLGQIAVPGFFCMSGYLFFRNTADLKAGEQLSFFAAKLRARLKSLVLPYLLWNLFYYLVYLLFQRAELSAAAAFRGIVLHAHNPVFWYMEELILLTAAAPVLYFLIRKRSVAFAVLPAVWLLASFYQILPVHPINEDAVFYYLCGAVCALHARAETESDVRFHRVLLLAGLVTFAACELIYINYTAFPKTFLMAVILGRISGVAALFGGISLCSDRRSMQPEAAAQRKRSTLPCFLRFNFLIYAIHYLEIRVLRSLAAALAIDAAIFESAGYLLLPLLCVIAAVCAGLVLERFAPRFYRVITGGRG